MSYHDRLMQEVNQKLDDLQERKQPWRPRFIAIEICKDHEAGLVKGDEDDENFWRHCGYEETMEAIGQVIKRRTDPDIEDEDDDSTTADAADEDEVPRRRREAQMALPLPGFKHLQRYYRIKRRTKEGKLERLAVHIDDMSDDECFDKAEEYDAQSIAMREHADELRRFARLRRRPAAE